MTIRLSFEKHPGCSFVGAVWFTSECTHASAAALLIEATPKQSLYSRATSMATGRRNLGRTEALGTRLEQRTCPCLPCSAGLLRRDLYSTASKKVGSRFPRCWPCGRSNPNDLTAQGACRTVPMAFGGEDLVSFWG